MSENKEKITIETLHYAMEFEKKIDDLKKEASYYYDKIDNRIDYIVRTICKEFCKKLNYYDYANADDDGNNGYFDFKEYKEIVGITTSLISGFELLAILDDGEWNLADGFPTKWLFSDFEQELKDGVKKYKDAEFEKKNKAKLSREHKKEENKKLAEEAKKKLSKEELKALKSTL